MVLFSKAQLENTPSRRDGIDPQKEKDFRRTYTRFIISMGKELKLNSWTLETACVFAHRFFALRSIVKNDRFLVATASLFLACKVDESPRNLMDLAYVYQTRKLAGKADELAKLHANKTAYLTPHMEQIMLAERALLYTLSFNLNVEHPFNHIFHGIKELKLSKDVSGKVVQLALNFVNDSIGTTLLIQYPATKVAAAALHKASYMAHDKPIIPDDQSFCDMFDVTKEEIDDIVAQFMESYVVKKPAEDKAAGHGQATTPHARAAASHASQQQQQHPVQSSASSLAQAGKPLARLHALPPPPVFCPADAFLSESRGPAHTGDGAAAGGSHSRASSRETTPAPVQHAAAVPAPGSKRARSEEEEGELPAAECPAEKAARAEGPNSPSSNSEALVLHVNGGEADAAHPAAQQAQHASTANGSAKAAAGAEAPESGGARKCQAVAEAGSAGAAVDSKAHGALAEHSSRSVSVQ